jgi:cellobiose phosphorylase
LILDPTIPEKWSSYSIRYSYLETVYEIQVNNPDCISKGVLQVRVDGEPQADLAISLVNDRRTHQVEVLMGMTRHVDPLEI